MTPNAWVWKDGRDPDSFVLATKYETFGNGRFHILAVLHTDVLSDLVGIESHAELAKWVTSDPQQVELHIRPHK